MIGKEGYRSFYGALLVSGFSSKPCTKGQCTNYTLCRPGYRGDPVYGLRDGEPCIPCHPGQKLAINVTCTLLYTRNTTFAGTREARLDFLVLVSGCLLVSGLKL